ncbi:hypothetical protein [Streptomyces sp. NPDC001070]
MLLYHYTRPAAWQDVLAEGEIRACWPIDPNDMPILPRVVHFTNDPDLASLPESVQDRPIRITVDVPDEDAHEWSLWARNNLPPGAFSVLAPTRFGGNPGAWYITERPVSMVEWREVIDLDTAAPLWARP